MRRQRQLRYGKAAPDDLTPVDVKKLGRIPDSCGHCRLGRRAGRISSNGCGGRRGHAFLHHAVVDHSRMADSEIPADERQDAAAGSWRLANILFRCGRRHRDRCDDRQRVLLPGEHAFAAVLGEDAMHRRTRPRQPQADGKVERFNRTLAADWAYAADNSRDEARAATHADWLHPCNDRWPPTGAGGLSPADRVHNLTGKNSQAPRMDGEWMRAPRGQMLSVGPSIR